MSNEQIQKNSKTPADVRTVTLRGPVVDTIDTFCSKYKHNSFSHCAMLFASVGADIFKNNPDAFFEILQKEQQN